MAALRYGGNAIRLIHQYKFRSDLAAGAVLAHLMARAIGASPKVDFMVPVPLARLRRRDRGFDQALELARLLSRSLKLDIAGSAVRRIDGHSPQSTIKNWKARRRNVRGVFHVEQPRFSGARIAIVDDVMTSGATADALATVLRAAGASWIDVWVACRAGIQD